MSHVDYVFLLAFKEVLAKRRREYGKDLDMLLNTDSFQSLCHAAGRQRHPNFPAKDGCTSTLRVLLEGVRTVLSTAPMVDSLQTFFQAYHFPSYYKTANQITHFDLLEMGLFGSLDTDQRAPVEIYVRNQNLKRLYLSSEKKLHALPTSSSSEALALQELHSALYHANPEPPHDTINQNDYFFKKLREVASPRFEFFHARHEETKIINSAVIACKPVVNTLLRALSKHDQTKMSPALKIILQEANLIDDNGLLIKAQADGTNIEHRRSW